MHATLLILPFLALGHAALFPATIIVASFVPSAVGFQFYQRFLSAPDLARRRRQGERVMFNPEMLRFGKRDAHRDLVERGSGKRELDFNPEMMRFGRTAGKFNPEMMRFGKRAVKFNPEMMRFGKRGPTFRPEIMRFGKRVLKFNPEMMRFGRKDETLREAGFDSGGFVDLPRKEDVYHGVFEV